MPRPSRTPPRERTADWPTEPSDDAAGEVARRFAVNLRAAIGERTLRATGEQTGVDHSTVQAILQGRTWPDLETIAKLEHGLGASIWPGPLSASQVNSGRLR